MVFRLGQKRPRRPISPEEQAPAPVDSELGALEARIGYTFVDRPILVTALTHSSFQRVGEHDYERLEFLGDAVLDLVVADLLLRAYPEAREGELSKMRAALVNTQSLAEVARELDVGRHIRLSRGEVTHGAAERPSILADVCEAIVGALYKDGGFPAAMVFVERIMAGRIARVTPRDPKTELQELLHARGAAAPEYQLECVEGPEHQPLFVSIVVINGVTVGRGKGSNKKASQQAAAAEALDHLGTFDEIDQRFLSPQPLTINIHEEG